MSWTVEGREYHSYAAYEQALARDRARRLRHLLDQVRLDPVDTSSVDAALGRARALAGLVGNLAAEVRTRAAAAEVRGAAREGGPAADALQEEIERQGRALDEAVTTLASRMRALDAASKRNHDSLTTALAGETGVDKARDADIGRRIGAAAAAVEAVRRAWPAAERERLGLDGTCLTLIPPDAEGLGGLALASRAETGARALAAEGRRRRAWIEAHQGVLFEEIDAAVASVELDDASRALVGDGPGSLRGAVLREAERLRAELARPTRWDEAPAAMDALARRVTTLRAEAGALRIQAESFDSLDEARHTLVTQRLRQNLERVLGEPLQLVGVTPGRLPVHPVEVAWRTRAGERVDCAVGLDGGVRVHHHGHRDPVACATAARRLAAGLGTILAETSAPRLDTTGQESAAPVLSRRPR